VDAGPKYNFAVPPAALIVDEINQPERGENGIKENLSVFSLH
jgi:hypothetical protein